MAFFFIIAYRRKKGKNNVKDEGKDTLCRNLFKLQGKHGHHQDGLFIDISQRVSSSQAAVFLDGLFQLSPN